MQLATNEGPVVAVEHVTYALGVQEGVKLQSSVLASHEVVCDVDLRICVDVVVICVELREACEVLARAWLVDRVICAVERKF